MIKAFKTQAIIGGVRARVDNSIGLTISTPELTEEEGIALFRLKGKNVNVLIEHEDGSDEVIQVKKEVEFKTPSQRLRSVIYVWWKQTGKQGDPESFYESKMNNIIESIKTKLEQ